MPVKFIINGMVTIKYASAIMLDKIKKDLTVENPAYTRSMRMGNKINRFTVEQYLKLYVTRGSSIIVPRGYMNRALSLIGKEQYEIIDNTICPELSADIQFLSIPREYQGRAIEDVTKRRYGILEAATGAGKTVMAISTIPIRKTKTLILVHNKELLYQWEASVKKFLGIECGLIGDGHNKILDITVGIINSVSRRINDTTLDFGYIIYDECHRTMGTMWLDVINTLMPRYHLGVTATPFRSDDTTKALFAILGPKLHIVDRNELEEIGAIAVPRIIRLNSSVYQVKENSTYTETITMVVNNANRNIMIAEAVNSEYKKYKEPILVVSDRKDHCGILFNLINAYPNLHPIIIHGSIKPEERKKKVKEFKEGKYNVLIATTSLIGEGFDSPSLGSLFLTTPVKFVGKLMQIIGRILRPSSTEKPRVYDVRDNLITVLKFSGFHRDRNYKKYGWE